MNIVQIVPFLPPKFCGIGDYARLLAGAMRPLGVETQFVVADPQWKGEATLDGFAVRGLSSRSPQQMHEALDFFEATNVFLHYVGYGYDDYGCPQWLLDTLQNWRGKNGDRQLVTMFHELYAFGQPPWARAFWSAGRQKRITTRIARQSDHCRTNMNYIASRLERLAPNHNGRVEVEPVFSTVGEPEQLMPLPERKPQMVLFGSAGWRKQAYTEQKDALVRACEVLQLECIVDIGSSVDCDIALPVPVIRSGMLPAEKVSEALSESKAGFFTYPERYFGKSTIFAAYCAHGVLPICAGLKQENEDNLQAQAHFWHLGGSDVQMNLALANKIACAGSEWYRNHSLNTQAEHVKNLLDPTSKKQDLQPVTS